MPKKGILSFSGLLLLLSLYSGIAEADTPKQQKPDEKKSFVIIEDDNKDNNEKSKKNKKKDEGILKGVSYSITRFMVGGGVGYFSEEADSKSPDPYKTDFKAKSNGFELRGLFWYTRSFDCSWKFDTYSDLVLSTQNTSLESNNPQIRIEGDMDEMNLDFRLKTSIGKILDRKGSLAKFSAGIKIASHYLSKDGRYTADNGYAQMTREIDESSNVNAIGLGGRALLSNNNTFLIEAYAGNSWIDAGKKFNGLFASLEATYSKHPVTLQLIIESHEGKEDNAKYKLRFNRLVGYWDVHKNIEFSADIRQETVDTGLDKITSNAFALGINYKIK